MTDARAFKQISIELSEHVLTVTLNRPERLNAWTNRMASELIAAIDLADRDDQVRVVIVTGSGRAFCAGADLASGGETFAQINAQTRREHQAGRTAAVNSDVPRDNGGLFALRAFESSKPMIAAINGPAVGIGVTMTLPMDIRLASIDARLGFVFTRRGIVPEACSSWFLPRIVGMTKAMDWVLTGRLLSAQEALAAGLLHSLHPPEELLSAARSIAQEIVANTAPVSVALTRRLLWGMLGAPHPMFAHRADSRAMHARAQSHDVTEGIEAFLAKRAPHFPDLVSDGLPDLGAGWQSPDFE